MHRHSYRGPTGLRRGGDATPRWRGSENSGHVLSHPEALSLCPCSFLPPRSLRGATCPPLLLRLLRALTEFTLQGLSLSCVPTATEPQQPPAFTTTVNRASFLQVPAMQVSKRGHRRGNLEEALGRVTCLTSQGLVHSCFYILHYFPQNFWKVHLQLE